MKSKLNKYTNRSAWIRAVIGGVVSKKEQMFCCYHRRISYVVMVDQEGVAWDVPVTEDLIKHHEERWKRLADTWCEIRGEKISDYLPKEKSNSIIKSEARNG